MQYSTFQGKQLSRLGFGAMRLPLLPGGEGIDNEQTCEMVDYALAHGVNYFDTAYPYHGGESEIALGRALRKYSRDRFFLATKFPGHQIRRDYDPAPVFEDQLKKCGVEYFDFYLLHNVYEKSIHTYTDPKWGIVDYFLRQKKAGRIRHLGFSTHGKLENMKQWLEISGDAMEFCQIQLNYMDWTLQDARAKVALLNECHIPIWVMEPVRGGKLAKLAPKDEARLSALRPDESAAAWAFRWLQEIPEAKVILSGMSDIAQMADNVRTFSGGRPLSKAEGELLLTIAEGMKDSIPCTACRYCTAECPKGLDIPMMLATYNEIRFSYAINATMYVEALPDEKRPSACIGCGKCARVCPQGIDIPRAMREFSQKLESMPSWAEICRQREEAEKRQKNG